MPAVLLRPRAGVETVIAADGTSAIVHSAAACHPLSTAPAPLAIAAASQRACMLIGAWPTA